MAARQTDRQEMAYFGITRSALMHISSRPSSTAETSINGCQTEKPRPSRSMAARRIGAYVDSLH